MKKSSRVLAVLMASAMALTMGACGSSTSSDSNSNSTPSDTQSSAAGTTTTTSDKTYNIGICQQLEHPALDLATQGFQDALTEKLGDSVTFDVQNAQNEQPNAATIANNFVANNVDLILANGTTALQCAAAATSDIPILGTSITNYPTALDMDLDSWTGSTGRNVSGTSDLAPIDEQEDMLLALLPDVKTVGILFCSGEANSRYQANLFEAALDADGIAYKEYTASDSNDITAVVQTAVSEVDAIYIPTDNLMAGNTETVNNITLPAKIPVIAGEEGICSGCGVATLSISYYDIGYKSGEMAYDILVNGADVTTMDIAFAPNITKEYNADICEELGITVPDDYVAIETEE
jgi:putative ABC transport system substrate-binding protein